MCKKTSDLVEDGFPYCGAKIAIYPAFAVCSQPKILFCVQTDLYVRWKPGGRELFCDLMRVHTPYNKVPYMLCLAAGLEMLHGGVVRAKTGGQLPLTFIKSSDSGNGTGGGKGQGKSGAAQAIGYLTGQAEVMLSPTVSKQEIKKTTSATTLPQCLEDIKDQNKLAEVCAWQYEEGQIYRTAQAQYRSKCEIFGTGNICKLDECHGDRVRVITFDCWKTQNSHLYTERRARFTEVIKREERPTRFSIGEAGDFFRSQEYLSSRTEFAEYLQQLCEVVKIRTLEQGYAGLLATLTWIIQTFGANCPVTEEEMRQWTEEVWVEQIRRQHVEKGNARHSILRYLQGVIVLATDMPLTQIKKFLYISKTTKLPDCKFALCLFVDPKLPLMTQNNVEVETVREHLLAHGGAIDKQAGGSKPGQGLFVRDFVDDDEEDVSVEATNKEQCTHKKCLLIPLNLLPDKTVMDFADLTGQQGDYTRFGADAGTPSVLSELGGHSLDARSNLAPLNSTSIDPNDSLHLNLTASMIQQPSKHFDTQEIAEEDLDRDEGEGSEEDVTGEEDGSGDESAADGSRQQANTVDSSLPDPAGSRQQTNTVASFLLDPDGSRQQRTATESRQLTVDRGSRQQDFDVSEVSVSSLNTRRMNMKAKDKGTKKQTIGDQDYLFCPSCKKPHTCSSALTRHIKNGKCVPSASFNDGIVIKCSLCAKICQSKGGLVRHTKAAHAERDSPVSRTLPLTLKGRAAAATKASELSRSNDETNTVLSVEGTASNTKPLQSVVRGVGHNVSVSASSKVLSLLLLSFELEICTI